MRGRVPRSSSSRSDHPLEPTYGLLEHAHRRSEGEPNVSLESRRAPVPPLAGVHVEDLPGHRDHLGLERGAKEAHAVVEGWGELLDVAPDVERALGRAVDAHAEAFELREEIVALGPEGRLDGLR